MKLTKVEEDQLMANKKPEPSVPPDSGNLLNFITKKMSIHSSLGAFIDDVRCFLGIFVFPTYPHQILYYISSFSKIR